MSRTPQDAAARLAAVGMTWEQHMSREQKRSRFVDPRNPIEWVDRRGLMLSFTGMPENPDTEGPYTAQALVSVPELRRVISQLETLPLLTGSFVPFTSYEEPGLMNLLGARDLSLSLDEVRWSRPMLGNYRLPLTPDLVADLRACLEVEVTMLALAGDASA